MKANKIMVAVSADKEARTRLLRRMAVDAGFALTPSDAGKLIRPSVHDIDLSRAYFVLADLYSFRESPITTQRLFELAARGIAVMVGTRRLPPRVRALLCGLLSRIKKSQKFSSKNLRI